LHVVERFTLKDADTISYEGDFRHISLLTGVDLLKDVK